MCSGNGYALSMQLSQNLWRQRWEQRWRWLLVFYWLTKLIQFHFIFWIFWLFALFIGILSAWCMVYGAYDPMDPKQPWFHSFQRRHIFVSLCSYFLFVGTTIKSRIYDRLTRFILYHSLFMTLLPAIHGFECSVFTVSYTVGWFKFNNIIVSKYML